MYRIDKAVQTTAGPRWDTFAYTPYLEAANQIAEALAHNRLTAGLSFRIINLDRDMRFEPVHSSDPHRDRHINRRAR